MYVTQCNSLIKNHPKLDSEVLFVFSVKILTEMIPKLKFLVCDLTFFKHPNTEKSAIYLYSQKESLDN